MFEVFKTNVDKPAQAKLLVDLIRQKFRSYNATFDLEDCDRVLCIKSGEQEICAASIMKLLSDFGYHAELLPDETGNLSITSILNGEDIAVHHLLQEGGFSL